MDRVIIVDLDGTLSNCEHRVEHVQKDPKDWASFNKGMSKDILNEWCKMICVGMGRQGVKTIFLTGRTDDFKPQTESWLKENDMSYIDLFMRPVTDRREDFVIKREIFETQIKPNYETVFVIEDRLSVVKMWREIGITCLQCDWGDF